MTAIRLLVHSQTWSFGTEFRERLMHDALVKLVNDAPGPFEVLIEMIPDERIIARRIWRDGRLEP